MPISGLTALASWIPDYAILEGPATTGVPFRYRGRRMSDGASAWIRVDGYPPDDLKAAVSVARIYQATTCCDHPDLPPVLGYGSTAITGRPFIAFLLPALHPPRPIPLPETAELLAEVQLTALDLGFAGIHVPASELTRLRAGAVLEGRRLGIREFLAEPVCPDGVSLFRHALPGEEWEPFCAPEVRRDAARGVSPRASASYRLGAQLHYLHFGTPPVENDPTRSIVTNGQGSGRPGFSLALDADPRRRPAVESFVC